jgi:hypothetical protein
MRADGENEEQSIFGMIGGTKSRISMFFKE